MRHEEHGIVSLSFCLVVLYSCEKFVVYFWVFTLPDGANGFRLFQFQGNDIYIFNTYKSKHVTAFSTPSELSQVYRQKVHLPQAKEPAKHSPVKLPQFFYGHAVVIWCCSSRWVIPGIFQKLFKTAFILGSVQTSLHCSLV